MSSLLHRLASLLALFVMALGQLISCEIGLAHDDQSAAVDKKWQL